MHYFAKIEKKIVSNQKYFHMSHFNFIFLNQKSEIMDFHRYFRDQKCFLYYAENKKHSFDKKKLKIMI